MRLHSDLHAGIIADRRGDELVAGGPHHHPGQYHRSDSDDSERARGHALRHFVSRLLPGEFRNSRRELAGAVRALVACGWFGIQTWIGGEAIYKIAAVFDPSLRNWPNTFLSINLPQIACFLLFWGINMFIIYKGIESIRILLNIKAPLLILLGLALLLWAYIHAHGFGPMLSQPSAFAPGEAKAGQFWPFFFAALTGMIGFWATLSLNIPDFSRFAQSQKSQIIGTGFGPSHDDGALLLHWSGRHIRDDCHLWRRDLGPRRPAHAIQ